MTFWMPKKKPLYAPMLSTFGGGSARGFGHPAPQAGDSWFINHGSGTVSDSDFSSSFDTYSLSSLKSGHYGMGTDSFHRYAILISRPYNNGANFQVFTEIKLDSNGDTILDISNSKTVYCSSSVTNSFGGGADATRGKFYHANYASNDYIYVHTLPSGYQTDESDPVGTPTNVAYGNALSGTNVITYQGSAEPDYVYHDYITDSLLIGGRSDNHAESYDAGSYTQGSDVTNIPITSTQPYSLTRDPSTQTWCVGQRNNKIALGTSSSATSYTFGSYGIENAMIAWTGALIAYDEGNSNYYVAQRL